MQSIQYKRVRSGETETLVVLLDGDLKTIPTTHAHYDRILDYLLGGGDDPDTVQDWLDVHTHIARALTQLSERVAFDGTQVLFDGDPINTTLSRHIIRLLREESSQLGPAVRFLEKLAQNPSRTSRMHLWRWLNDRDFTLLPDGNIVGYKAVRNVPENLSITSGNNEVTVNGTIHTGCLPNPLGAEVAMQRSRVNPDREEGCSIGLHVGTWEYAADFGGPHTKILTVSVNPRDVVAVPRDCDFQKMRVCRYRVITAVPTPHETPLAHYPDTTFSLDGEEDDEPENYYWDH